MQKYKMYWYNSITGGFEVVEVDEEDVLEIKRMFDIAGVEYTFVEREGD